MIVRILFRSSKAPSVTQEVYFASVVFTPGVWIKPLLKMTCNSRE